MSNPTDPSGRKVADALRGILSAARTMHAMEDGPDESWHDGDFEEAQALLRARCQEAEAALVALEGEEATAHAALCRLLGLERSAPPISWAAIVAEVEASLAVERSGCDRALEQLERATVLVGQLTERALRLEAELTKAEGKLCLLCDTWPCSCNRDWAGGERLPSPDSSSRAQAAEDQTPLPVEAVARNLGNATAEEVVPLSSQDVPGSGSESPVSSTGSGGEVEADDPCTCGQTSYRDGSQHLESCPVYDPPDNSCKRCGQPESAGIHSTDGPLIQSSAHRFVGEAVPFPSCAQCGNFIHDITSRYMLASPGANGLCFCRKDCARLWQEAHPRDVAPPPPAEPKLLGPTEQLRREIVEALRSEARNDREPQGYANQLLDRVANKLEARGGQ